MNASDSGVSDGAVGVDSVWKRKLGKLLAEAPLADSLLEAVWPLADLLHGEGMEDLIGIIEDKSAEWCDLIYSPDGGFNLPRTYRLDFAIAIYVYTLALPSVHSVINKVMFNPTRRTPGAAGAAGVSDDLRACMPYIKFLDAALEALPPAYVFIGEVRRGVGWVYPSPDHHDPKRHFAVGGTIMWYEFKSTSKKQEVMTRPHFCGVEPGPRTIFTVEACRGYDIEKFSYFQGVDSEFEVLFRPLSRFKVLHAVKNIINPKDTSSLERSGFPDAVALQQSDDTPASWSVRYSAEHRKAFFCNDTSGETTWDAPSAVLAQQASQLVQAEAAKAKQEEEDRKLAMQLQQELLLADAGANANSPEIHAETHADTPAPATMQIFVKDPAGKTVTIDDVVPSDTIATALNQLERKTKMRAPTNMRYVYRGRPLDIDKPWDHYGIARMDTIHCYLAPASLCDTRAQGDGVYRKGVKKERW